MKSRHDVQFWEKRKRSGRRKPWEVRWRVADRSFSRSFLTAALADKYRGDLVKAAGNPAEVFSIVTGEPESWERENVSFYAVAQDLAKRRWKDSASGTRKIRAENLAACTLAALDAREAKRNRPDERLLRRALREWAFVPPCWGSEPEDVKAALAWAAAVSLPVSALEDADILERVLDGIGTKVDGGQCSAWTYSRHRGALHGALGLARDRRLIASNPLDGRKPKRSYKTTQRVSPRQVPTLVQARALLEAVRQHGRRGAHFYGFFAVMYYAGCRPAEVINLKADDLTLPEHGWGEITLTGGSPDLGSAGHRFTDDGLRHDPRGLKSRADNEVRVIPIPPDLVRILRDHMAEYPLAPDRRLFYLQDKASEKAPRVTCLAYERMWRRARRTALGKAAASSKLAARPYDLRHGNASFLLGLRIAPTEVARRLGHSVATLHGVYAHWLTDMVDQANAVIEAALAAPEKPQVNGAKGGGLAAGQDAETRAA